MALLTRGSVGTGAVAIAAVWLSVTDNADSADSEVLVRTEAFWLLLLDCGGAKYGAYVGEVNCAW